MKTVLLIGSAPIFLLGVQNTLNKNFPSLSIQKLCLKEFDLSLLPHHQEFHYFILDLGPEKKVSIKTRKLLSALSCKKILVFGNWEEGKVIKGLFKMGVNAYLSHQAEESDILEALNQLEFQDHFLTLDFKKKLIDSTLGLSPANVTTPCITPREKEVLNLILEEYTTREIAEKLFISSCTAETHRLNLINKFGVKNTAGLVREAVMTNYFAV